MKISIIIPTYNRARLLPRALESVLKQGFKDWELIIVDDGSTDNTREIVQKIIHRDKRVKYCRINKNRGFMYARNVGVKKATGGWICFLDSDDEYLPGALGEIVRALKKYKSKAGVIQFMIQAQIGQRTQGWGYRGQKGWQYHFLSYEEVVLKKNIKVDTHRCLKASIAKKNPVSKSNIGLETLYYADLSKRGVKFLCVNKTVVQVHQSPDGHSRIRFQKWPKQLAETYVALINRHYAIFKNNPMQLFNHQVRIMRCFLETRDPRFLWWGIKAFLNQPKKFIVGVKRHF